MSVPPTVYWDMSCPVALSPAKRTVSRGGRACMVSAPGGAAGAATKFERSSRPDADKAGAKPPNSRLVLAFARCTDSRAVPVNTLRARTTRKSASASTRCSDAPGTYAPTVARLTPSPYVRLPEPPRSDAECSCTNASRGAYAVDEKPALDDNNNARAPVDVPSCRVRMLITPLIASAPYNAAPCGPRITSTRSTRAGSSCVTSNGFATSIPSR